jgi:hypothetical protein
MNAHSPISGKLTSFYRFVLYDPFTEEAATEEWAKSQFGRKTEVFRTRLTMLGANAAKTVCEFAIRRVYPLHTCYPMY